MKTRDDAWYWMSGCLNFSRIDRDFMNNVRQNRLKYMQPLTLAQADLWEKLVFKYQRQIRDNGQDPDAILALPWGTAPIDPAPDHSTSRIWVQDHRICMAWPYHQKMIQSWREWRRRCDLACTWDPELKIWSHELTLIAAKSFLAFTARMRQLGWADFQPDPQLAQLQQRIEGHGPAQSWRATARSAQGRIMISNLNRNLLDHLPDMTQPCINTLERLADLGVDIHPELQQMVGKDLQQFERDLICQRHTVIPWYQHGPDELVEFLLDKNWRVAMARGNTEQYLLLELALRGRLPAANFLAVTVNTVRTYNIEQGFDLWISPIYNSHGGWYDIFEHRSRRVLSYLDPDSFIDTLKDNP